MPRVLLGGLPASDPAGSRAVRDAVDAALPNHRLSEMSDFPDGAARLRAARRSSAVLLTGIPLPRAAASGAAMAAMARGPLVLFGVSCGPVHGPAARMATRQAVRQARLLLLSDEESATHLAAAGAPTPMRVCADPAWLGVADVASAAAGSSGDTGHGPGSGSRDGPGGGTGPESPGLRVAGRAERGESVAVALDAGLPSPLERALAEALVTVARAGRPIRLIPWQPSDTAMGYRLAHLVDGFVPGATSVDSVPETLADAATKFAAAHVVVALRYRAVHAAAAASVPVIGVGTDPRTSALASHLGQAWAEPFDLASRLPVEVERIRPEGTPEPEAVRAEIGRARAGLRLLRLVMEPDAVAAAEVERLPLAPVPWVP